MRRMPHNTAFVASWSMTRDSLQLGLMETLEKGPGRF
jgi:hypothetical protein